MAGRSGRRNPDSVRVAAAQIGGTAERCIIGLGLAEDQALVEIGASLGPLALGQRKAALDYAAARYVDGSTDADRAIASLLERAGADIGQARIIQAERGGGGFVVQ